MARLSMRNVQKSPVSEYFDLFLSSAAARGVKDKTLSTYKQHFHSISKRLDVILPLNRLNIMLLPMLWGIDGVWISVVVAEFMSLVLGGFFLIVKRKTYHY